MEIDFIAKFTSDREIKEPWITRGRNYCFKHAVKAIIAGENVELEILGKDERSWDYKFCDACSEERGDQ